MHPPPYRPVLTRGMLLLRRHVALSNPSYRSVLWHVTPRGDTWQVGGGEQTMNRNSNGNWYMTCSHPAHLPLACPPHPTAVGGTWQVHVHRPRWLLVQVTIPVRHAPVVWLGGGR